MLTTNLQLKEQRKQDLVNHVEAVNAILRKAELGESDEDSEEEFEGLSDDDNAENASGTPSNAVTADREEEYIDEDRYTTVTVKSMDKSDDEASSSQDEEEHADADADGDGIDVGVDGKGVDQKPKTGGKSALGKKKTWTKDKPDGAKPKKKKKKFRYESKIERKATRSKQKTRNSAAAKERKGVS